jgi:hypothetical protein
MMKNAKMKKSDLSLSTYTQYVEDFKFWIKAAGDLHNIPEKEIVKLLVNGMYSKKKFIQERVKILTQL